MDILLVFFYCIVFSILIGHPRFFKAADLSKIFLIAVFLLKCILGIAYTYIHINKYGGSDTLQYFNDGNIIFNTLFENPLYYLELTFGPNGIDAPQLHRYIEEMGYWGDTSAYMVVRFNAFVNLFSLGNFYVHSVFMAFLSFTGLYYLYKAVKKSLAINSFFLKASLFFIPSVMFWTSGVHKEGLLIFGLGLFFYSVVSLVNRLSITSSVLLVVSSAWIFFTRDFFFLLLVPGLIAFIIALKIPKTLLPFVLTYFIIIVAGIMIPVFDGKNYLEMIAYKQQLFTALETGHTNIALTQFDPTLKGLIVQLPEALKNVILGPFFIRLNTPLHIIAMIGNIGIVLAIVVLIVLTDFKNYRFQPLATWFLFYALSLLALIGYIVPNVGAIVRYRSLALPFLFLFLISNLRKQN